MFKFLRKVDILWTSSTAVRHHAFDEGYAFDAYCVRTRHAFAFEGRSGRWCAGRLSVRPAVAWGREPLADEVPARDAEKNMAQGPPNPRSGIGDLGGVMTEECKEV